MSYYNKEYFDWQKNIGKFGGIANLFKFEDYIKPTDTVLDFGCGGGFLLSNINCKDKIGIEINEVARENAKKIIGEKVFPSVDDVTDTTVDVIISNHALEHCYNPLLEIEKMKRILKSDGKIIFVVPFENSENYNPEDINMHLFTWTPQNLANLFKVAGYNIIKVEVVKHMWPSNFSELYNKYGLEKFHKICRKTSKRKKTGYQTRIVCSL